MQKGQRHTVEARLKQSIGASRRWAKLSRKRKLEARLKRAASRANEDIEIS